MENLAFKLSRSDCIADILQNHPNRKPLFAKLLDYDDQELSVFTLEDIVEIVGDKAAAILLFRELHQSSLQVVSSPPNNYESLDSQMLYTEDMAKEKQLLSQIIEAIQGSPRTFVVANNWKTSIIIPKLSTKTRNMLSELDSQPPLYNLGQFCDGKFEPLAPYCNTFSIDDMEFIEQEELLGRLPLKYKVLGSQFFAIKIYPLLKNRKGFTESLPSSYDQSEVELKLQEAVCDLSRGCLISSRFQQKNSINFVLEDLEKKDFYDVVKVMSLSDCNLVDEDMEFVFQLTKRVPQLDYVDLSFNRFHGLVEPLKSVVDTPLLQMLDKGIKVNIIGNALASIDRIDLFDKLTQQQLEHLIWILKVHFDGPGWKYMVKDKSKWKAVQDVHQIFYNKLSKAT